MTMQRSQRKRLRPPQDRRFILPANWLISRRMAEISHSVFRNFFRAIRV